MAYRLQNSTGASEAAWLCRDVLWAPQADSAVPQEDLGGVHWGLPHHCGRLLVPGWLPVQVQVDDLPPHGTALPPLECTLICLNTLWQLCLVCFVPWPHVLCERQHSLLTVCFGKLHIS